MANRRYTRRLAALMAIAALGCGAEAAWAEPLAPAEATRATKAKPISTKQRAKIRRELQRQVRRNPAAVLEPGFVKKAALVDYQMPLTVRLSSPVGIPATPDDQIEVTWDDSIDPWPLAGTTPAPVQTVTLTSGIFTMEADFGGDASGAGEVGAVETSQGLTADIRSQPFDIASDPNCLDAFGNPSPARVQALRDPSIVSPQPPRVKFTSGGARYGLLNMFSEKIRGSVMLKTSFITNASNSACATPAEAGVAPAAPLGFPLRYNGEFHLSPAITSDGKMRLGKIVVDDATLPQALSLAKFSACTTVTPCNAAQFTAHVKVKHLTADVLLGDIRSSS
jgi:hypothetical protein